MHKSHLTVIVVALVSAAVTTVLPAGDGAAAVVPAVVSTAGLSRPTNVADVSPALARALRPFLAHQELTVPGAQGFGYSVAISGTLALIGAPGNDNLTGAAYVFSEASGTWSEEAELTAAGGIPGDWFGLSVALSGGTALVGAPYVGDGGDGPLGAVYVFTGSGRSWPQPTELTVVGSGLFGYSVALSGTTALVGSPATGVPGESSVAGSAYVFNGAGATWSEQAELTAPATWGFGTSVALSGTTALVGSPHTGGGSVCAVYVFTESGGAWTEQAELRSPTGGGEFGDSVALSGFTALIGAYNTGYDRQAGVSAGAAYVFVDMAGAWSEQAALTVPGSVSLGQSVALSGDIALVGADGHNDVSGGGGAYAFTRSDGAWSLRARAYPLGVSLFGYSVALSGTGTAMVGSNSDPGIVAVYT